MQTSLFLTALAEPAAGATGAAAAGGGLLSMVISILPMILIFYFLLIRPQKKQEKKFREMLAALQVGDNVIMSSGIEGKIITVKEDSVTIETGADRVKLTFKKWAIKEVTTQKA